MSDARWSGGARRLEGGADAHEVRTAGGEHHTSLRSFVRTFEQGDPSDKISLGGKGANLCAMTQMGLNVPPGFVITATACLAYLDDGRLPDGLMHEVRGNIAQLEAKTGKRFGDPANPLLVSVRSGSAMSMPGMMDTILNLGLNPATLQGLVRATGNARFAYDAWRRFIQLFGKIAMGIADEAFDCEMAAVKRKYGAMHDVELTPEALQELAARFTAICREHAGRAFPDDPYEQLQQAIEAVFRSWNGRRAVDYRRQFRITSAMANGTAVNVMAMVFGNMGHDSATGVGFTRNPATGENEIYGEYLTNAQGEDVVAGIRTPKPIAQLAVEMPDLHRELLQLRDRLESHYAEVQDFEFTIEKGRLYCLQTRNGKMNAHAMVVTSVEMARDGLITMARALDRIAPALLEQLLVPTLDPAHRAKPLARGRQGAAGARGNEARGHPRLLCRARDPHRARGPHLACRGGRSRHGQAVRLRLRGHRHRRARAAREHRRHGAARERPADDRRQQRQRISGTHPDSTTGAVR
jgi:pyruvate, orthophosphate dikinase